MKQIMMSCFDPAICEGRICTECPANEGEWEDLVEMEGIKEGRIPHDLEWCCDGDCENCELKEGDEE